ncbi:MULTISPECIES: hypothetical protein [Vagococcus]|uniref:Lipoprotein n=1 Tax=Vagococcus fluvialis bH819 TaxID=1255619 RepID=A0A1X6WN83_9ENTE|nr:MULTISPECIES: hypothetical protein [Vagococcus]SLM85784.1 hypothetical protein FM121_06765 [Vagococcus fluvialis bH819]HCM90206.1 hypothetical protein [Vagococcus sp.]
MKNKRVIVSFFLLGFIFLVSCSQNNPSIKLSGIEVEKTETDAENFKPYQTVTDKEEIKIIQEITKQLDDTAVPDIAFEGPTNYQFYFTYDVKDADVKPAVYQLQKVTHTDVYRLNNLELSVDDSRAVQKILIEK